MTNREFIEQNKSVENKIKVLNTMGIGTTPKDSKELNLWDKRRWLVLTDFWMDRISKEHADDMLEQITKEQEKLRERAQ